MTAPAESLVGLRLDGGDVILTFRETAAETGGERHVQEARYAAGSRVPPYHHHPKQDERFVLVEGALRFLVGGQERIVKAGETLDVPRGVDHYAHNPFDEPAVAVWETRPALRTAQMFRALYRAAEGRERPPLLAAAVIFDTYRDEFVLAKPPRWAQRVLFGCLAPIGRLAGHRSD